MWLKLFVSLIFMASMPVDLSVAQSISSTAYEFQQITFALVTHQNRVRSMIDALASKVNSSLADVRTNGASSLTVTALDNIRNSLTQLRTLDSYVQDSATMSCNDIAIRAAGIQFDIQRTYQIYYEVLRNSTLIIIQLGSLNVAFVANYYVLSSAQQSKVQTVVTALTILIDEYNQYALQLLTAVASYVRISAELLYCKRSCNCPTQLSQRSSQGLANVDSSVKLIQSYVSNWEGQVRGQAKVTIDSINAINPNLKSNMIYLKLTQTLDSIATLMNGYLVLTTYETVNASLTCDDAASKLAFVQYKIDQYYMANIEAQLNTTAILVQLGYLNSYYAAANALTLLDAQKQGIQAVVSSLNALIEDYRNYILSLITGWTKLVQLLIDAKAARYTSCDCTGGDSGTITTAAPGTTAGTTQPPTTIIQDTTSVAVDTTIADTSPNVDSTTIIQDTSTTFDETTSLDESTTGGEDSTIGAPLRKCTASDQFSVPLSDPSGNYIKTACFIDGGFTQPDADAYCTSRNMVLFQIDSAKTQSALINWLQPQIEGSNVVFRIDGLKDEEGDNNWYYNSYGKSSAFSGLNWLINADTLTGLNSLVVTNMAFPMTKVIQTVRIDGLEPTYLFNVLCEYK